jgi:hypothetical protein
MKKMKDRQEKATEKNRTERGDWWKKVAHSHHRNVLTPKLAHTCRLNSVAPVQLTKLFRALCLS